MYFNCVALSSNKLFNWSWLYVRVLSCRGIRFNVKLRLLETRKLSCPCSESCIQLPILSSRSTFKDSWKFYCIFYKPYFLTPLTNYRCSHTIWTLEIPWTIGWGFTWASSGSGGVVGVPEKWGKTRDRSCVNAADIGHWQTLTDRCSWRSGRRLALERRTATGTRRWRPHWQPPGTNLAAGQPDNWCRRIPICRRKNNHPLYGGTDRRDRKGLNSTDLLQCRRRSVHAFLHGKQQNMSCKLHNKNNWIPFETSGTLWFQ